MIVGDRFGQLTLLKRLAERHRGNVVGLWLCDCGATKKLPVSRVKSGNAKSCGCLKLRHGHSVGRSKTPEYSAWMAMRARCGAASGRDFEAYVSRGITVCSRWDRFETFLEDVGPKPSPAHSLGRRDNDGSYEPSNCRWETPAQQMQNTRKSRTWHVRGRAFPSCRAAAAVFGVDHKTIRYWVKTGAPDCYVVARY
jgi:hypothetical protein